MGQSCEIRIIDTRNADESMQHADPILRVQADESKVSSLLWGTLDETLLTGHENGEIILWDLKVKRIDLLNVSLLYVYIFYRLEGG